MRYLQRSVAICCLLLFTAGGLGQQAELLQDADAWVELDKTEFEIANLNKAMLRVTRIIRINNEKEKERGYVSVNENSFHKCKNLKAEIQDIDGNILRESKKDDVHEEYWAPGFIHFNNSKYKWISLTWKTYPYVVKYEYEVEYKTLFNWPDWYPQEDIPVVKSEYILKLKQPIEFNTFAIGFDADSLLTRNPSGQLYRWSLMNIEPRHHERYMPPETKLQKALLFVPALFNFGAASGSFNSWDSFASWYRGLIHPQMKFPIAAQSQIDGLLHGIQDDRAKIEKLYAFLQNYTHYVAIYLGVGGWQPHSVESVFHNKYGDCKDLSVFMIAMLKHAGIDAYPALTLTRDKGVTLQEFPYPNFNHCITFVPMEKDTLWLECTADWLAAGELPKDVEGCEVLVVEENGGKLVKTPVSPATDNWWQSRVDAVMLSSGTLNLSGKLRLNGNQADYVRNSLNARKPDEQENWLRARLGSNVAKMILHNFTARNLEQNYNQPVEIAFSGKSTNFASRSGKRLFLNPNFLNQVSKNARPGEEDRRFPINYEYAYMDIDSIAIQLPIGYVLEASPEPEDIQTSFGQYRIEYTFENQKLIYRRLHRIDKKQIPITQYAEYKTFLQKIIQSDNSMFVFKKSS